MLPALPSNIRLGCKGSRGTNDQAYLRQIVSGELKKVFITFLNSSPTKKIDAQDELSNIKIQKVKHFKHFKLIQGIYHCTIDLLFDWFGISCVTTDNFYFYLQNRLIQTSQTGGQWYSDTSPFSIPWLIRTVCQKWNSAY
jgi:hypothetical protein